MNARDRFTPAEHLVRLVLDALADANGFEPYWFSIPLAQGDLSSSDLLRGGKVPLAVLERVQDALGRGVS
jgi:hypothetical protein